MKVVKTYDLRGVPKGEILSALGLESDDLSIVVFPMGGSTPSSETVVEALSSITWAESGSRYVSQNINEDGMFAFADTFFKEQILSEGAKRRDKLWGGCYPSKRAGWTRTRTVARENFARCLR